MAWNKTDVVKHLAESKSISTAEATRQVNDVLLAIQLGVVSHDKVILIGHGTYEKRVRKARKGRNPQTGAEIQIAESVSCGFKSGKSFNGDIASVH